MAEIENRDKPLILSPKFVVSMGAIRNKQTEGYDHTKKVALRTGRNNKHSLSWVHFPLPFSLAQCVYVGLWVSDSLALFV